MSLGDPTRADRLIQLRAMLAARTDGQGRPNKGWTRNVYQLRREIALLETTAAVAE